MTVHPGPEDVALVVDRAAELALERDPDLFGADSREELRRRLALRVFHNIRARRIGPGKLR